ncbi:Retrovirus-related Pol polyprotein from transposon TNT 1-94 [Sesamum angolense]|uniref:Retrovirus-related Pol polyprotein from transposon TNT 1-94 n=1 Tax=Sesamum angolense TaxID=2727404 RepID=A0AAE2BQX7_9LAMI|nr:Retrovirus-related Pol polyprotein from transposon TNT 1-94 [Sesamum angolense]
MHERGEVSTSKVKGKRIGCQKRKKGKAKAKTVVGAKDAKSAPNCSSGNGALEEELSKLPFKQGMLIAEVNMITNYASWVLDTGCGAHICNGVQVLERSKKLSKDEVVLRPGDGKAVATKAVEIVNLVISDRVRLELKDWYNSEAFVRFKEFKLEVENQTGCKMKTLQTDRGTSSAFTISTDNVLVLRRSARVPQPPERYRFLGVTGELTTFKDRLVAKGYIQQPGVDFEETFLPVAMAKSIHIMLAMKTWYNYEICQKDVKTTFLNCFVEKEIYMDQPERFIVVREEQKRLVEASYIFGIKIFRKRSKRMLGMTQNSYVEKVLQRFKMEHSERGFLPMRYWVGLSKKQSHKTDEELKRMLDIPYASTVGIIQYAA